MTWNYFAVKFKKKRKEIVMTVSVTEIINLRESLLSPLRKFK